MLFKCGVNVLWIHVTLVCVRLRLLILCFGIACRYWQDENDTARTSKLNTLVVIVVVVEFVT